MGGAGVPMCDYGCMTPEKRQRIAWFAWTAVLVSSLVAIRVLNSQATATAHEATGIPADARFGFRLEESAKLTTTLHYEKHLPRRCTLTKLMIE